MLGVWPSAAPRCLTGTEKVAGIEDVKRVPLRRRGNSSRRTHHVEPRAQLQGLAGSARPTPLSLNAALAIMAVDVFGGV